jgi:hypothetical protein
MLVTMREEESPAPHELHMRRKLCSRCTDKLIVELVHGHCLDSALITDGPESCHGLPAPDLIAHFISLLPALFLHSTSVCSVFSSMYRRVHISSQHKYRKRRGLRKWGSQVFDGDPCPHESPARCRSCSHPQDKAHSLHAVLSSSLPAERSHQLAQLA